MRRSAGIINSDRLLERVLQPDVLRRVRAARQHFVEVPFQKLVPAGASHAVSGLPMVVRDVIDLAIREAPGWVIVDYKTETR